MEQIYPVY